MNIDHQDVVLIRTADSHWWKLEGNIKDGFFRWTAERADFRIINQNIKSVEIQLQWHPTYCGTIIIKQDGKELISYNPNNLPEHNIKIDIKNQKDFEIYCNTFVPNKVNNSSDFRNLGIMVRGFVLHVENESYQLKMNDISEWFPIIEIVKEKISNEVLTIAPFNYTSTPFNISTPLKRGAILYLDKTYPRIIKQLKEDYKFSKSCELITYTDNSSVEADIHVPVFEGQWMKKYDYANVAAQMAIQIAQFKEWDYFMWLEWDCYVGKDCWFDVLWEELLAWPYKPIQAGTPVISTWPIDGNFEFIKQDYIASYLKANKVSLRSIYVELMAIAINGAFGFYEVNMADKYLVKQKIPRACPFDFMFGLRMLEEYQEDIFKHTAWLPSLYSVCGNQYYTEAQRLEMVKSGFKVAMHQYKVI